LVHKKKVIRRGNGPQFFSYGRGNSRYGTSCSAMPVTDGLVFLLTKGRNSPE
jgi:hypothetical protein